MAKRRKKRSIERKQQRRKSGDLGIEKLERRDLLAVQPFPTPLEAVDPEASLIYEGASSATIDASGETETFTIELDAAQTVSLVVDPSSSLEANVSLRAPDGSVLATATSPSAGAPALIQTASIATTGTYSIDVADLNTTSGDFTVALTLNASIESEEFGGPTNDIPADAEALVFTPISTDSNAETAAVRGVASTIDSTYSNSQTVSDTLFWPNVVNFDFAGTPAPSGDATLTFTVRTDLKSNSEFLNLDIEGLFSQQLFGTGGSDTATLTTQVTLPQATVAALAADGTISLSLTPSGSVDDNGGSFATVAIEYPTTEVIGGDWYQFSLDDGEVASLALVGSNVDLELFDSDQTTRLAVGGSSAGATTVIPNFVDQTTDGAANDYFLRISGDPNDYDLVITKDALIDTTRSSNPENGLELASGNDVLGYIGRTSVTGMPVSLPANVIGSPLSLGFNTDGSFSGSTIGMRWNSTEFLNFGTFLAGYTVGFNGQTFTNNRPDSASNPFAVTVEDLSSGSNYLIQISGEVQPGVNFVRLVEWSDGDDYASVTTSIDNQSGATLSNLALLENIDPDPGGTFSTNNDVVLGDQLVVASNSSGAMGLGSTDPQAVVSAEGFEINDPFLIIDSPSDPDGLSDDAAINLAFDIGDLADGSQSLNTFRLVFGNTAADVEATFSSIGSTPTLPFASSSSYYTLPVTTGDNLSLSTLTPGDLPGEFVNTLDPALELLDPTGTVVASDDNSSADGRNATLNHTATMTGLYTVRVSGAADTSGEFVLQANGFTGTPTPFTVTGTSVNEGDRFLPSSLTDLTVDLSGHLRLDSVDTSDLLINGVASATAVTVVDADTLRFDLPALAEGATTFSLPAGTVTNLQGQPLEAFTVSVVIDQSGPRVISTSVLEGDILAPGSQSFSVTFDEPINQTVLNLSDLQLTGSQTGNQPLSNLLYDAATNTLTFDTANLAEDLYTLRLISGANAFVDPLGNLLDGEAESTTTVPSGDGTPGGDFLVNFEVDTALAPLPAFTPVEPLGSLIYEASASGLIGSATDIDDFTVELDAGQTLTLQAQGAIQPRLTLLAPDATTVLGTVDASAPGEEVALSAIPITTAGTYIIQVSDLAGTPGDFNLLATLNAQLEIENIGGPTNDIPADAEALVFTPISTDSNAERAAVRGFVSNVGPTYSDSQTVSDTLFWPNVVNFDFAGTPEPSGDATLTFTVQTDLGSSSEFLTLNIEGLVTQNLFSIGGSEGGISTAEVVIPQATVAALAADGTISLTLTPTSSVNNFGGSFATVDLEYSTASVIGDDWYLLSLDDGEAASFALDGNNIGIEIYDQDQTTLIAEGYAQPELDSVIENFVDQTTDGVAQDYFIRVVAGNGDYQLVATRGASFDVEQNDQQADAQDITGSAGALGYVEGITTARTVGDEDWYSVSALAGDVLDVALLLPASGPGEFENALATGIPGGIIISEVVDGAAGDGNPKFIEITNTSNSSYTFAAGGIIVQTNDSTDRNVDIDLTGLTLAAGQSYVVASSLNDGQTTFESVYGFSADRYADEVQGDGNDRYALTDAADGSSLLDVYGVLDINGNGRIWEYTDGYATRLPAFIASQGDTFESSQWVFSGVEALDDGVSTPEALLQSLTTPGSHSFVPGDTPLARVALFDASGGLVVPDAQSINYTVPSDGFYSVRVSALTQQGEYFVSVGGATGSNLAPQVVSTTPLDGALLTAYPTTIEVTFSETLLEGSITASDLLINGVAAATAVTQTGPFTFEFDIDPVSNIGDGSYAVEIPAAAATDLQGIASDAFVGQFTLDGTGPQVVATTLNGSPTPVGVTILEGNVLFTATFSETLQDSLIDAADVVVTDSLSSTTVVPDSFSYDATTNVLTLDFANLEEGAYEVRFLSNTASFVDLAGNLLDGEALGGGVDGTPTGDGTPGGDYVFEFQVDGVGSRAVEPFTRLTPLGGLIFVSEGTLGLINQPADVDDFEVYVQANETVSAIVTPVDPNATLSVSVVGLAGPFTAAGPGQPVAMPAFSTPVSGPLTYRVIGDRTTEFRLDAYLNVAPELAVGDSTISSPLSIDSTAIELADGVRYGALGQTSPIPTQTIVYQQDFALGNGSFVVDNNFGQGSGLWHFSTGRQLDGLPGHSAPNSFYFGQGEDFFSGGNYETGAPIEGAIFSPLITLPAGDFAELEFSHLIETDNFAASDIAEVAVVQGSTVVPVLSTADGTLSKNSFGTWETAVADLSEFAGSGIRLRFRFDTVTNDDNLGEGWFIDDIVVRGTGASIADLDAYSVNLTGSEPVDIVFDAQGTADLSDAIVQLLDIDGSTVLATASLDPLGVDASNYDLGILGYTPTTPGNYTIRVAAANAGDYTLVVTESLSFETEPNDGSAGTPTRDLAEDLPILGFLGNEASAGSVWGVQPASGNIVRVDPATGAIFDSFAAPGNLQPFHTAIGLSLAEGGNVLLYQNANDALAGTTTLYRLDPLTGAVLSTEIGDGFSPDGLSHQTDTGTGQDLIFQSHPGTDLHRQVGYSGPTAFFWGPGATLGGVGGDDNGRLFANYTDGMIHELNPYVDTGFISGFPAPSANIQGLAFDGASLYASNAAGDLFVLNPDTGEILGQVAVDGGALYGLGALGIGTISTPGTGSPSDESSTFGESHPASLTDPTSAILSSANTKFANIDKFDPLASAVGIELAGLASLGTATALAASLDGDDSPQFGAMDLLQIRNDLVLIDAIASGDVNELLSDLTVRGIQAASVFGRMVSGWLPIGSLEDVAALTTLQFARPSYLPVANVGATTSQADVAMGTDTARTTFGIDGTGVTIGILSDTFDGGPGSLASDVFSGDLPGPGNPNGFTTPVNILSDGFGSDEGRAMAQLIHDVAPGADLAFHTAFNGEADFASGIIELQSVAGADVIVDDIIYFAEPMFQDGIIAQAIDTVVANGASYFSSAGNNARDSWEGNYQASGTFVSGRELHDFDPGPGVDTLQSVTVPVGASVRLSFQWDSPFFSVSGGTGSPNDLDLFVYDSTGTSIIANATTNNIGGDAVEVFSFTNRTRSNQLNLAIGLDGGPAPGLMKWVAFDTITPNEYATNSPTAYGHANAAGASAVGAARYQDTPAFGTSPPIIEPFSSAGGIPILFDITGSPINDLRAKPDIVAPDGTNTTFFGSDTDGDGFPNFFGTSAAAPHAAALAGLMLELNPIATPAEIYAAMESTAIDMDDPSTPGFDVGFDSGTGHGLVDANAALTLIEADPALVGPRVVTISPATGVTNDLNITSLAVEFSEALDTASANDAANYLLIEAGPNGIFEDGGGDDTTVTLNPTLTGTTSVTLTVGDGTSPLPVGNYRLVLEGDTSITDVDGNPLNSTTGPGGGSDTTHEFSVVFELPRGGDTYRFTAEVGDVITLATSTVLADPLASPLNDLDPQLVVFGPNGNLIAMDQDSGDGVNAELTFTATVDGIYVVQVAAEEGVGEYLLSLERDTAILPADFNRDLAVNGADFLAWQRGFGSTAATQSDGDANGNNVVDADDLALWKDQYGSTANLGNNSGSTNNGLAASLRQFSEESPASVAFASSFAVDTSEASLNADAVIAPELVDAALVYGISQSHEEEDSLVVSEDVVESISDDAFVEFEAVEWHLDANGDYVLASSFAEDEADSNEWLDEQLLEEIFS